MFHLRRLMLILAMLVLLAGCAAAPAAPAVQCRIVLESSPAFTAQTQTAAVTPGQSVTFTLTPADGYTLTGADYPGASLTRTGAAYILTLPDVRYSVAVAVTAEKSDTVLYYNDNCGGGWVTVPVTASHLRLNTAIDDALFTRPGYTLTGWNTAPDGSGQAVGLGSRTEPGARLYAQWAAQNDAAEFTYTVENDAAAITGWQGGGEVLVIPDTLGGAPVVEIAAGAFADLRELPAVKKYVLHRQVGGGQKVHGQISTNGRRHHQRQPGYTLCFRNASPCRTSSCLPW